MNIRREFLRTTTASLAAASFSKLLHASPYDPQAGPAASPATVIDWHAHWIGPTVVDLMSKRTTPPRYVVNEKREIFQIARGGDAPAAGRRPQDPMWFDAELRLRHLDQAGVQRQVLSFIGAAYDGALAPEEARPIWRAQNDDLGALVKKHPDRFSGLATLPTANPQWAAEELERAHRDLGLIGATLPLDAFVTLEGARALVPVFAIAQKYRSHIFVHRGVAAADIPGQMPETGATNAYFGLVRGISGDYPVARTTLITSAHLATGVITLALTDFLDPYPDVTVQMAMIGGSIAFVAEQIEFAERAAKMPSLVKKLRRVYLDTGSSGCGPRGIALAAQVFGADRILFGSDNGPQPSVTPYIESVQSTTISAKEKQAIFTDNGRALLAQKGVRI